MTIKFLKALWEWLFGIRGYLSFEQYNGSFEQQREIALKKKVIGGKARYQQCKVCGKSFWAMKAIPFCKNIRCLFSYRMRKQARHAVTTKHNGIVRNHTVHAHSISEVLRTNLPGKIKQISKIK